MHTQTSPERLRHTSITRRCSSSTPVPGKLSAGPDTRLGAVRGRGLESRFGEFAIISDPVSNLGRPPRVLEILYSFGVGGSELLGLEVAKGLAARGVEVFCTSITGLEGPLARQCASSGLPVVDLGLPKSGIFSRNGFSADLVRRLKRLQIDSLHVQHFLGLNKLGLPARLAGIRHIAVTEHSVLDVRQSLAGRMRIRLNWRLAHAISVVHPDIKRYLVDSLGVDETRITCIPVGVDVGKWHCTDRQDMRARLGIGPEFVFAFAGRIAPVKNVPGLIRSYLSMQELSQEPSTLLIVGSGEDLEACKQLASGHPHGHQVRFVGEQSDVRPYLAAADAFVMNSHSEGTPRAMLEAMAMGLPCVSTSVGGIPDMLKGRGWLTQPGDEAGMAVALAQVIGSPAMAAEARSAGREYVLQNHNLVQTVSQYLALLNVPGKTHTK